MEKQRTVSEIDADMRVLREDPQKYVALKSEVISKNPDARGAYYSRHEGWLALGKFDNALSDLNRSMDIEARSSTFLARGDVLARMGRFREALADFQHGEAMDTENVIGSYWPFHQAHCHAELGDEATALKTATRISDSFFSPGIHREPRGNKQQIIDELRRRAAKARQAG